MALDGVSFSLLDTNKVHNTPGRLDAAEIAVAHRAGCIWAREGQDEAAYNKAQDEYIEMMNRGLKREIEDYREELVKEICESEIQPYKRGDKALVTNEIFNELLEFEKSRKSNKKAEKYMYEHFTIMTPEQLQDRYQRAYNALWKINNTLPANERRTNEELLQDLSKIQISQVSPTFMSWLRSSRKK